MEQLERARGRLRNIRSVRPILSAMRTIALGSRAQVQQRQRLLDEYRRELIGLLAIANEDGLSRRGVCCRLRQPVEEPAPRNIILLVVGTLRGFCGAFNESLASYAGDKIRDLTASGHRVSVLLHGARLQKAMSPHWRSLCQPVAIPGVSLPSATTADALVRGWMASYESREVDEVAIVSNAYRGMAKYAGTMTRVLPPHIPHADAPTPLWPPIVDTDPEQLLLQAISLWTTAAVYGVLLESGLAEHSARYQLMDGAAQNAGKMIEEPQLYVQMARQQAITLELQDLAGGAGLLGPRPD